MNRRGFLGAILGAPIAARNATPGTPQRITMNVDTAGCIVLPDGRRVDVADGMGERPVAVSLNFGSGRYADSRLSAEPQAWTTYRFPDY